MILASALLLSATALQPPREEPDHEELLVTAPRRTLPPLAEPAEYFRRHCFDANRLNRQSSALAGDDPDWEALDEDGRRQLGIGHAGGVAATLFDPQRGHRLVLSNERRAAPAGLTENRCSLIVIGGTGHARLRAAMAALFGGTGTSRHIGLREGAERIPGWRQQIWTGMPQRGSSLWREIGASGSPRPGGTFLVVADLGFYDNFDFILGDLKQSEDRQPPVSVMSLVYTYRPRR
jgi:hypothetical protein